MYPEITSKSQPITPAFAMPDSAGITLTDSYNHFGVSEEMIRQVMNEALSNGGDYCDVFFQHKISNTIRLEDNLVNRAYSKIDFGVGIRVIKGDQTGFSFTSSQSGGRYWN